LFLTRNTSEARRVSKKYDTYDALASMYRPFVPSGDSKLHALGKTL
jgi:hypothetical protein